MPMVSVIIPVYKSEKVLRTAVSSVQRQSFGDWEILLIDDGSPDHSPELCEQLAREDSRIRVFHKENGGTCSARNDGLERAAGKYIAFLDHDDEYMDGYFSENIPLLEKYQADVIKFERLREVHLLNGGIQIQHGTGISHMSGLKDGVAVFSEEDIHRRYPQIRQAVKAMYIWDGIYRRDLIMDHPIRFDEIFRFGHEDIMFNLEVYSVAKKIVFHSKEYYKHKYRQATSTSASFHPDRVRDALLTSDRETRMLRAWHYPEKEILYSHMNSLFLVMNMLTLPGANVPESEKRRLLAQFREGSIMKLHNPAKAVYELYQEKKLVGLLANAFYKERYGQCLLFFKAYQYVMPKLQAVREGVHRAGNHS